MPVVNNVEYINYTAAQLDEIFFNINFGSVNYKTLKSTITYLFLNQTVSPLATINSSGAYTGNNAKMIVTFIQSGNSTNCDIYLYQTSHENLSNFTILIPINLGAGDKCSIPIDPFSIPQYTFAKIINNDSHETAIVTIEITTWNEQT